MKKGLNFSPISTQGGTTCYFILSFSNAEIQNFLEVSFGGMCDPERTAPGITDPKNLPLIFLVNRSIITVIHTYIHTLLVRPQGAFQSQNTIPN